MKIDKDIEQLLMSGEKLTLSTDERSSIKSTLLAHATQTLQHEKRSVVSPWTFLITRISFSLASLLLIFVGTAYAAQDSLPGEPLYAVKVHVVEEIVALTKTTAEERVAYDAELMETRLYELKALTDQEITPAPETIAQVSDQIDEHVADVTHTVKTTASSELSHEKKIEVLSRVAAIAKAQSKVVEEEEGFSDIVDTASQANESASDVIATTIEDFANEKSAEDVSTYLSDQMDSVSDQITASSTDYETRNTVGDSLRNVDEALIDGSINDAIFSITEANQIILTDQYVGSDGPENNDGSAGSTEAN